MSGPPLLAQRDMRLCAARVRFGGKVDFWLASQVVLLDSCAEINRKFGELSHSWRAALVLNFVA